MSVKGNGDSKAKSRSLKVMFNCSKCPAYCCSYDRIEVTKRDMLKIAQHFGISYNQAEKRYTKIPFGSRVFRHKKDHIFNHIYQFLDSDPPPRPIHHPPPSD